MDGWTSQRVLALAPDAASAKAGEGLAAARKWVSLGFDERAAWGECQGSGSKPYQVQVELGEPAFKCSCPSRKFPCKHGIGLMLMFASDAVARAARPAWVEQWLDGRVERTQKRQAKADAPPAPADEAAQARRREKRLGRVGEGLAALKLWSEDLIRGGVATAPSRGYAFFDEPAKRMVDAQAPGVARRLQALAGVASGGAGWQRPFVEALASLHLLVRAHEQIDALPEDARHDVLATLGIPCPQEEVLAGPAVRDRWQVVAQETTTENRLRVQRTWLYGAASGRPALVLAFSHVAAAAAPADASLAPGFAFDGDLCFYPGNTPRAAVKARGELAPIDRVAGLDSLDGLCDAAADLRARNPWADELALPVRSLVPVRRDGGGWALVDGDGRTLPARATDAAGWRMLAVSGGQPVDVVLGYDWRTVRPLALFRAGEYTPLIGIDAGADA
jgi:hypothetical protein